MEVLARSGFGGRVQNARISGGERVVIAWLEEAG